MQLKKIKKEIFNNKDIQVSDLRGSGGFNGVCDYFLNISLSTFEEMLEEAHLAGKEEGLKAVEKRKPLTLEDNPNE